MIFMKCSLVAIAAFIIINIMSSVGSEDCICLLNYLKKREIFVLNEPETVEFLSTQHTYVDSGWSDTCVGTTDCKVYNEIRYKNNILTSLYDTDFRINDDDLNTAVYKSFSNTEALNNVVGVFTNRYAVRTRSEKVLVFSIKYGTPINVVRPNCTNFYIRFQMSSIKGLMCKISFVSGVRSRIKCEEAETFFYPIDEDKNLQCEIRCET
jgi:hypothetical protein